LPSTHCAAPSATKQSVHRPLVDCHFHSRHSGDGEASLIAFCQQAMHLGLSYICPTEHADFDPQDNCYGYLNVEAYSRELAACRGRFDGQITVLQGVEVDYQPRFGAKIKDFLAQHTFDFIIGSTHYVEGLFVANAFLDAHDPETACRRYFEAVRQTAASGLFDVVGHLDLIKRHAIRRWGSFDRHRYAGEIEMVLQAALETGTGLEINTSGLRGGAAETFPGLETLCRYRELGGQVLTLGSDAHCVADLGKNIHDGLSLAQAAGFETIAVFVAREPRWLEIG
jgi:histidinol-phosphatase (PHP family)